LQTRKDNPHPEVSYAPANSVYSQSMQSRTEFELVNMSFSRQSNGEVRSFNVNVPVEHADLLAQCRDWEMD